jgi:hypothetical protein
MTEYQYKLVNGELVELTPDEIAEHEELGKNPPPMPQPAPDQGARANARLDAGIEAAQPGLDTANEAQSQMRAAGTPEEQLAALQDQVNGLQQAFEDMLLGHTGPTPRSN